MLKQRSIRWRLTILTALLLTLCCVGLTVVLNLTAFHLVDTLDAVRLTPATHTSAASSNWEFWPAAALSYPAAEVKRVFSLQSLVFMTLFILGGSALTHYVAGKALQPLHTLNTQVKNISAQNLAQSVEIPPSQDEISELAQSFQQMTDKLNQAFLTQKRFSANAAHELRTPLAVLQTKIDVFHKHPHHTPQEYETLIHVLEGQVGRLRGLVKTLLDMTSLEDPGEVAPIQLNEMLEDILSELTPVAQAHGVLLHLSGSDHTITGNLDLLYRAFFNLVENGIKYNRPGGCVNLSIAPCPGGGCTLYICDSGIGIPENMKSHIFEPFFRVDKSRSRAMGGAGLGLALVHRIISAHGGTISVSDRPQGGTCFQVTLPHRENGLTGM